MNGECVPEKTLELLERLNVEEWRAPIFLEIILDDLKARESPTTVVEIGCGIGFDSDLPLQKELAGQVSNFIGVEPDMSVQPQDVFSTLIRSSLEHADIPNNFVDLAFSVMVMEHVNQAKSFMESVLRILKPGGVYWGFTVDRRHWFTTVAHLFSKAKLKSLYLSAIYGKEGDKDHYIDYPTAYLLNEPGDIENLVPGVERFDCWSYGRIESAGTYAPKLIRPLINAYEKRRISKGGCRTGLAVRIVK